MTHNPVKITCTGGLEPKVNRASRMNWAIFIVCAGLTLLGFAAADGESIDKSSSPATTLASTLPSLQSNVKATSGLSENGLSTQQDAEGSPVESLSANPGNGVGHVTEEPWPIDLFLDQLADAVQDMQGESQMFCEVACQSESSNESYIVRIMRSEEVSRLTFYTVQMTPENMRQALEKSETGKPKRRLELVQQGTSVLVRDTKSRLEAAYDGLSTHLLQLPDTRWLQELLTACPREELEVVRITGGQEPGYSVTVKRIFTLDAQTSGIIRMHVDPDRLRVQRMTFLGSVRVDDPKRNWQASLRVHIRMIWGEHAPNSIADLLDNEKSRETSSDKAEYTPVRVHSRIPTAP